MNNEIAHNINSVYAKNTLKHVNNISVNTSGKDTTASEYSVDTSQALEQVGYTNKVGITHLSNGIKGSLKSFVQDPLFAEAYNDVCDGFVAQGCNLEDAILKTDEIFKILKSENTYKN